MRVTPLCDVQSLIARRRCFIVSFRPDRLCVRTDRRSRGTRGNTRWCVTPSRRTSRTRCWPTRRTRRGWSWRTRAADRCSPAWNRPRATHARRRSRWPSTYTRWRSARSPASCSCPPRPRTKSVSISHVVTSTCGHRSALSKRCPRDRTDKKVDPRTQLQTPRVAEVSTPPLRRRQQATLQCG